MLKLRLASICLLVGVIPLIAQPTPGSTLPGTWTATAIVEVNILSPGAGGTPRQVGDAWLLGDGALIYWAKIGEKDKGGWALYAAKDGVPRLLFTADEEFDAPDGVKKRFRHFDFGSGIGTNDLLIGRTSAYTKFVLGRNQGVYTISASGLTRVLSVGDTVKLAGAPTKVKQVDLHGITPDGRAVLKVTTEKPDARTGWLVHDGRTLAPLWSIGDPIPGDPASARIEGMNGVPRMFGDTTLVIFWTKPVEREVVLFRLTSGKAERLLTSGAPDPMKPERKLQGPRDLRAAAGDRFVVGIGYQSYLINRTQGFFAWQNDFKLRVWPTQWLGHTTGRWRNILVAAPDDKKVGFGPLIDSVAYVRRDSDSLLIAGSFLTAGATSPYASAPQAIRRVPAMYVHDGTRLVQLALLNGRTDLLDMSLQLEKSRRWLSPFGVHQVPGAADAVVAEISGLVGGSAVLRAGEPALSTPARFVIAGEKWSPNEADLIGWIDERTAIVAKTVVGVSFGYYRLVRQ